MRIYKKPIEITEDYYEVPYTEYREDGTVCQTGTEDFSKERWIKTYKHNWVWTWDGEKRNKGGYRWFECIGCVTYAYGTKTDLKKVYSLRHPAAAEVQVR